MSSELLNQIKAPKSWVYRKAYIRRRDIVTGQFEDEWQEITDDVISFGTIKTEVDAARVYTFRFGNAKLVMDNSSGRYSPHENEASLWYHHLNQQRTLVRIEAGFIERYKDSNGIWQNTNLPGSMWDEASWDVGEWDSEGAVFTGIISGDIPFNTKDEVTFNLKPLTSVLQDFPAKNLTGFTTTGMTASQFVTMVRDQTDGSGNFVFKPFFGDTTTYWDISSTSITYANLNTATAKQVFDKTVWEVIEKLAEVEDFVPYVTPDGTFKFVSRGSNTSTAAFQFYGEGYFNSEYGQTIKEVNSFGRKLSKYYSRVQVKWAEENTTTSYEIREADFAVSPVSNPWVLGHRTLQIENLYIPTSEIAATIASTIFSNYSALKNEIEFTTSFIPHLSIFDRVAIYYDPYDITENSMWDQRDWAADNTDTSSDLIWDPSTLSPVNLNGEEFNFLSIEVDLDKLETRFTARET